MVRLREGYSERKRLDRVIDCTARSIFIIEKVVSNIGDWNQFCEQMNAKGMVCVMMKTITYFQSQAAANRRSRTGTGVKSYGRPRSLNKCPTSLALRSIVGLRFRQNL